MFKYLPIYRWGVYHWEDFRFKDGNSKNKFWIALVCRITDPKDGSEKELPSLLPTSQWEKYKDNLKQLVDTVVLEPGESRFFSKKTVLDLNNIQWVKEKDIYVAIHSGRLTYKGKLEDEICKRVELAIEQAETLSPRDIRILLCRETE
ncbi:hypothetical protein [Desulfurobacterium crinifex]